MVSIKKDKLWIAKQNWEHILFLHWPISEEVLSPYVKEPFKLQTFNNKAWLTMALFQATGSQFRLTPKWTTYPPLTQINARTYVKLKQTNETGVYFFSLNVNSLLGTLGANLLFGLPFNFLQTTCSVDEDPYAIQYRMHYNNDLLLHVNYKQNEYETRAENNELNQFLTERYCLLTKKGEQIIKIPISHTPWELKNVEVQLQMSQIATENFDMFMPPQLKKECTEQRLIAHYSRIKRTKLYAYEVLGLFK